MPCSIGLVFVLYKIITSHFFNSQDFTGMQMSENINFTYFIVSLTVENCHHVFPFLYRTSVRKQMKNVLPDREIGSRHLLRLFFFSFLFFFFVLELLGASSVRQLSFRT